MERCKLCNKYYKGEPCSGNICSKVNYNSFGQVVIMQDKPGVKEQIRAIEAERYYFTSRCIFNRHVAALDEAINNLKKNR